MPLLLDPLLPGSDETDDEELKKGGCPLKLEKVMVELEIVVSNVAEETVGGDESAGCDKPDEYLNFPSNRCRHEVTDLECY